MKKVYAVSEAWDDYLRVSHIFGMLEKAQAFVKKKYGIVLKVGQSNSSHGVSLEEFELE